MARIKAHLIPIIAAIVIIAGSQLGGSLSLSDEKAGQAAVKHVLAEELVDTSIFLPIVSKDFPMYPVFGMDMGYIAYSNGLAEIAQAQNYWLRRGNIRWSEIEPNPGERNWSMIAHLETQMLNATSEGMPLIMVVTHTPSWAQQMPGVNCGPIKPENLDEFAVFLSDIIDRYSRPPYNVKYWELWNEPDASLEKVPSPESDFGCWGQIGDPYYGGRAYGEMLKVAYPSAKQTNPTINVLLGGLLLECDPSINPPPHNLDCTPSKFLEGILQVGGGPYFDGISFHAYEFYADVGRYANTNWGTAWNTTGPVIFAKSQFLKNVLSTYGVSGKFLMNTEAALLCGEWAQCNNNFETTKAYYIPQVYGAAIAEGLTANVWYSLYGWRGSELWEADGTQLPAYQAYVFARAELRNAAFIRHITEYSGVMGYELDRYDRRIWLVWSLDGNPHTINLPGIPLAIWDAMGEAQPVNGTSLNVTLKPLYVEWHP